MAPKEVKDALDLFREAQASVSKPAAVPKPEHQVATTDFLAKILERIQQHELKKQVVRDHARAEYARAMSKDPYERHAYHHSLKERRYSVEMLKESQNALREQWDMAAKENRLPTEFITSPDQVQHSAVAAEYIARITALPSELRNDPRVLYAEASRAYHSIDWQKLTAEEEAELKLVIERTFARMHELARTENVPGMPDTDKDLWWGMGDYYLSRDISPEEAQLDPANPDQQIDARNQQRRNLKNRLKRLQSDLSQFNSASQEKKLLEDVSQELQKGKYESEKMTSKGPVKQPPLYFEEDVERVRRHLSREIDNFDIADRPSRQVNIERPPTAVSLEDLRQQAKAADEQHRGETTPHNLFQDITPEMLDEKFVGQEALQQQLLELRKRFEYTHESRIKGFDANSLATGQQMVRDLLRERNLTAEQKEIIKRFDQRLEGEIAKKRQQEQPMSRFYLTPEEIIGLDEDPIGTIDSMVSKVFDKMISDPEDIQVRAYMDRMDLMNQYLFSNQYDAKRLREMLIATENMAPDVVERLIKIRERLAPDQKDRLSRTFTIRWHAARWYREWANTDSPSGRQFSEFINTRMNEDDFFGLDGIYGPLVARAREILRVKYEARMYKDGISQAHNPEWYTKALQDTVEELIQNDHYRRIYEDQYLKGRFFMSNPDAPTDPNDPNYEANTLMPTKTHGQTWEQAAKTITNFADIRFLMSGEKFNMDIRYRTPRFGVMAGQIHSTFWEKQRIAKLMRPFTNFFETWEGFGGKTAIERAIIRHRANIMRRASPDIDIWARDWTDRLMADIARWKSGGMQGEEERELFAEVAEKFFFQPDKLKRPPDPGGPEFAHWLKQLSRKTLEEEVRVYSGMLIDQQHTMRPYLMMFESGYRNGAQRQFMSDMVSTLYGRNNPDEGRHIFLAGHVVDSANGYFMKKYVGDPEHSRNKFVSNMKEASRYRPHSMAMVLKEGGSRSFERYTATLPGGKKRYAEIFSELSLRFDEIRSRILEQFDERYTQIDYLAGPNAQQMEIIDAVFADHAGETGAMSKDVYLHLMQDLSQHLVSGGWAEEFSNIRYAPLLSKGRWDDYPYEWLQYPERYVNKLRVKYPDRFDDETVRRMLMRASERFIGEKIGEEQSGPFRRMWRDLGAAQTVFDQMPKLFDPDPKVHSEAFQTAYSVEVGYQGPMHAAMNVVMAAGGLEGAEKVYGFWEKGYGPFREGAKGSNDFSVYGFSDHKGKSVDELRETIEHILRMTSGNVAHNAGDEAAALLESAEAYLGITNYRGILLGNRNSLRTNMLLKLGKLVGFSEEFVEERVNRILDIMNDRYPIGIIKFKGMMALPYVALLLALVVVKEIQRGGKEESHH